MRLHRAKKRPDWADVAKRRRNGWQRVAQASGGLLTIGNGLTIIGLLAVLAGLFYISAGSYWLGAVWLVAGRLCDLFDGWLAEWTATKSPLGESFDAGADKLATAAALIVLPLTGTLPHVIVGLLVVPQLLIAGAYWQARRRSVRLHPSLAGKLSMAGVWLCIGLFVIVQATGEAAVPLVSSLAWLVALVSGLLAMVAATTYYRQIRQG